MKRALFVSSRTRDRSSALHGQPFGARQDSGRVSFLALAVALSVLFLQSCGAVRSEDENYDSVVRNARPISSFTIPPKDPDVKYLQFEAVGDGGTGMSGQKEVAESMSRKASEDSASFILVLGDNFYESGVSSVSDPQWQRKFEDVYSQRSLQIPFYAILGNHDYRSNPQAEVKYSSASTRWRMPDRYYTFSSAVDDSTRVQFFCIDTTPLAEDKGVDTASISESDRRQVRWLDQQLQESSARWKIVLGHHTIYSGGEHGDDPHLAALIEPLFEKFGVDVYLCGHDHHQEILKPIRGVYYIVSGAGGKHRSVTWRDNTLYAGTNLGFTWYRVSRNDLLVEFYTRAGKLDFAYTISK